MTKNSRNDEPFLSDWVSEILITTLVASGVFYFYYGDIFLTWRFTITLILSIIYTAIIYFFLSFLSGYLLQVNKNRLLQKVCREAGIDPNSSDASDLKKYKDYLVNRYSSEKFVNRITDLIGTLILIVTAIVEATTIISIMVLLIYLPITHAYSDGFFMLLPITCHVIYFVIITLICFLCKLLLNRYPNEAKEFNKALANYHSQC